MEEVCIRFQTEEQTRALFCEWEEIMLNNTCRTLPFEIMLEHLNHLISRLSDVQCCLSKLVL